MAMNMLAGGEPAMPSGYGMISRMTPEQLFFTSAANTWCSNWPDAALIGEIENDPHSPDMFRVMVSSVACRINPCLFRTLYVGMGVSSGLHDFANFQGSLQNVPAFANAFKCMPGSTMAPKKHCTVWTK